MHFAPAQILGSALWPVTIWFSFAHLDEHPADGYVGRTSPIAATAIGFWLTAAGIAALWFANGPRSMFDALLVLAPLLYAVGFLLFAMRDAKYRN